jgi:hypothetical protein
MVTRPKARGAVRPRKDKPQDCAGVTLTFRIFFQGLLDVLLNALMLYYLFNLALGFLVERVSVQQS